MTRVGIVIRLQTGRPRFRIPARARYSSALQIVNISSVARVTSNSIGTWIITSGKSAGTWNWPPHLHLAWKLRMSGVIPLLPIYGFMSRDRKTFFFITHVIATVFILEDSSSSIWQRTLGYPEFLFWGSKTGLLSYFHFHTQVLLFGRSRTRNTAGYF